jgi:hypothetical protein
MLGEKGQACYYCGDDTYIKKVVISLTRIVITYQCERCKATEKKVLQKGGDPKSRQQESIGVTCKDPKNKPLQQGGY